MSRSVFEVTHPDDLAPAEEALSALARGGDLVGFETRIARGDGSYMWVEWNTRTMPTRGVVYGVGRDTTELRRARDDLQRRSDELRSLAEEQGALRRVATLVALGTPPEAVFDAVAREVGEVLGVDAVHLGRYDGDGTVAGVAQWGRYGGVPVGTRFPLDGDSVSARVLRTAAPARVRGYEGPGAKAGGVAPRRDARRPPDAAGGAVRSDRGGVGRLLAVDGIEMLRFEGDRFAVPVAGWGARAPAGRRVAHRRVHRADGDRDRERRGARGGGSPRRRAGGRCGGSPRSSRTARHPGSCSTR